MILYFATRYIRYEHIIKHPFVTNYLTDLLFVPAMCLFALIVLRFLKRDSTLTISWLAVMIQVVVVSLYFEWYLPKYPPEGHTHIADIVDCLMYTLGGFGFMIMQPFLASPKITSK